MSVLNEITGKEFIYWPLAVKGVIWLAMFMAAILAGYILIWSATIESHDQLVKVEEDLKKTLSQKLEVSQGKMDLVQQITRIEQSFGELLRLLPTDITVEGLIFDLNQVGASKGITVSSIEGMGEVKSEYYVKIGVRVSYTTQFSELGRFVEDLSRLPRIVTMHSFDISRVSSEASNPMLKISAVVNTFRNLESASTIKAREPNKEAKK